MTDSPQGERKRPEGMPSQVPPTRLETKPPAPDTTPRQKPVTDEPEPLAPPRWKGWVKKGLTVLGLLLALSMVYVFLLMGEPDEDDQLTAQNTKQEESIRVPIAATEVGANADLNPLAVNFGKPVLALYGSSLPLQKAVLYDTAFRGGYARRLTLTYALADGGLLVVDSIRPTAAVSLLGGSGYSLNMSSLYTLAGMDAVRMDATDTVCVLSNGQEAAYAVRVPANHADELSTLLKQASLMQPATP